MYIHHTDGIIDLTTRNLPKSWRNVSGLDKATAEELQAMGWVPVRVVSEQYDATTQIRTGPTGAEIGDSVLDGAVEAVRTFVVRDKTPSELDADKDNEILIQITEHRYNRAVVRFLADKAEL